MPLSPPLGDPKLAICCSLLVFATVSKDVEETDLPTGRAKHRCPAGSPGLTLPPPALLPRPISVSPRTVSPSGSRETS